MERWSDRLLGRAWARDHLSAPVTLEDSGQITVTEALGLRGDRERLLDCLGAVQLGQRNRLRELAPQIVVPAAAAAISHRSAPGPISWNACSSADRAQGLRSSAPGGRGA